MVFGGLEQAIGDLLKLAFSPEQIAAIRRPPEFRHVDEKFMNALEALRFEGDLWSVPEGTVVFAGRRWSECSGGHQGVSCKISPVPSAVTSARGNQEIRFSSGPFAARQVTIGEHRMVQAGPLCSAVDSTTAPNAK
jgi:hypothetical protein